MFVDSQGLGKYPSHILRIHIVLEDPTRSGLSHFLVYICSLGFAEKFVSPLKPLFVNVSCALATPMTVSYESHGGRKCLQAN